MLQNWYKKNDTKENQRQVNFWNTDFLKNFID